MIRLAALTLCALALLSADAHAYWSAAGSGGGTGAAAGLSAPTISVPATSGPNVVVTFTQQASLTPASLPSSAITYTVERRQGTGSFAAVTTGGCAGALPRGTASCTDRVPATANWSYRVVATFAGWTTTSAVAGPVAADATPPSVVSITRAAASPTAAASVSWTVTFSEAVTGVDATDFALARTGVTGGTITAVTGTGATRTVTATTGTGSGTLGLNLTDDDTILDADLLPLGGAGAGNGNATGALYTLDRTAPTVPTSVIANTTGSIPGFIRQGGLYFVYANVTDATGAGTVTANVSTITTGQTAVPLVAGSFSIGGVTYTHRSAQLTANATLTAGAKNYTVTAADTLGNTASAATFSVTADNTAPTAAAIQTANGATTVGRAEQGDTITYTFSEAIDPISILAGWDGTATDVVLRLNDGGLAADTVTVFDTTNATQLSLGSVSLASLLYTTANRTFGLTGTKSRMVLSGNAITITLGTASGAVGDVVVNTTMVWTPSTAARDRAANPMSATTRNEANPADREF